MKFWIHAVILTMLKKLGNYYEEFYHFYGLCLHSAFIGCILIRRAIVITFILRGILFKRNYDDHPGSIARYWHISCLVLVTHILNGKEYYSNFFSTWISDLRKIVRLKRGLWTCIIEFLVQLVSGYFQWRKWIMRRKHYSLLFRIWLSTRQLVCQKQAVDPRWSP